MLDGVILLWFILTAASVLFVAVDIRNTPESPVLKWGFILVTAYTGPIGAFLYVLGCREPLPGTHERYVAAPWRQVLGSTMHCVAGDGVGILAGAVIAAVIGLSGWLDVLLEYLLGFGFGWMIFQALFMRDMAGGSYSKALRTTFTSELLSMNLLMAGMVLTMIAIRTAVPEAESPLAPEFWFAMSTALLVGAIAAYPMNWWLVSHHLKHGMMTVRPTPAAAGMAMEGMQHEAPAGAHAGHAMAGPSPAATGVAHAAGTTAARPAVARMALLSFAALAAGLALAAAIASSG
jgi:hypothetical protein